MERREVDSIEDFIYNGFFVEHKGTIAPYTVKQFIKWTDDPGIGLFLCSDGRERLIPSCQLTSEYVESILPRPVLDPFNGKGVLFGASSKS